MGLDERKISLCIPNFNRYELLINSFINVLFDDRIDEIIITDDLSEDSIYEKVKDFVAFFPKVKLIRNPENYDCYKNKYTSVTYAKNPYCILFDSDNTMTKDYLDKIFDVENWGNYAALLPSFAMPHFNYKKYEGYEIRKDNVHQWISDPTFHTMLNTANYLVNKEAYINAFDTNVNPHTADSIFMNYKLLSNGGKLYVVPNLHYEHRVDDHHGEQAGHYGTNHLKTGNFHNEVLQKLKDLR